MLLRALLARRSEGRTSPRSPSRRCRPAPPARRRAGRVSCPPRATGLEGGEAVAAQPLRPIGNRARHGPIRSPGPRRSPAPGANTRLTMSVSVPGAVTIVSTSPSAASRRKSGASAQHLRFVVQHDQPIAASRAAGFRRRIVEPQRRDDRGQRPGVGRPGRQREFIAVARARHFEHAGLAGAEPHAVDRRVARQHEMPARQRRMAAQRHFDRRR